MDDPNEVPRANEDSESIDALAVMLRGARRVLFITGAGVSADSGLPTYRGVGGLYEREATEEGLPIEVALSGDTMASAPEVCWKYVAEIEAACRGAVPNGAHRVIAAFESVVPEVWVLTQNVDGFHQAAGSTRVLAIHGDLRHLVCTVCPWGEHVADYALLSAELGTAAVPRAPHCPRCGAVIRPNVVLFDEMLPAAELSSLQRELAAGFDVVVSVGTSSGFAYIAAPVIDARRRGAHTVEVNPSQTEVSALVDLRIAARAEPTFESLWARVRR